ncbi:MAG: SH3 domain-containing protein, partial [Anaerolineaceae bacterium]|nr:SH3 domain-containing protein [Anaerolineaceae bacterium]
MTSSPAGPFVTVRSDQEQYINVRSGPGIFYEKVGVILAGQQLPAKGRSAGGDWILVEYLGVPGSVAWV